MSLRLVSTFDKISKVSNIMFDPASTLKGQCTIELGDRPSSSVISFVAEQTSALTL